MQSEAQPQAQWGKVLDQTRCIGCHACTTACKSENLVPLGVMVGRRRLRTRSYPGEEGGCAPARVVSIDEELDVDARCADQRLGGLGHGGLLLWVGRR